MGTSKDCISAIAVKCGGSIHKEEGLRKEIGCVEQGRGHSLK